jgi:polyhydroxyalkanoate synthesis repressor PhaR
MSNFLLHLHKSRLAFPLARGGSAGDFPAMKESAADAQKTLNLKKYANRRYYDSSQSRHLTLEEIRSFVQRGYDVRVTDAKTGDDITPQMLTQIILELDTPKLNSLPVPLLVRIIRVNDQLVKDFIEKYFNQALKSFLDYQQELEEQIRRTHGLPSVFPSVSLWTKAMLQPFAAAFRPSPDDGASSRVAAENTELRQLIRDLQAQVQALSRPPGRPARRGSGNGPSKQRKRVPRG